MRSLGDIRSLGSLLHTEILMLYKLNMNYQNNNMAKFHNVSTLGPHSHNTTYCFASSFYKKAASSVRSILRMLSELRS